MSLYNSIQSNAGQIIAGVGIPGTDVEVGMPEIPFKDVQFENNQVALTGAAALALGVYMGINSIRNTRRNLKDEIYTPGQDFVTNRRNRNSIIAGGTRIFSLVVGGTALVAGGLMDRAEPYTDESRNMVDSVAVVIDSGYESLAEDVDSGNGEINRITAAVNGTVLSKYGFGSLEGIDVSYIAAGANPEFMGQIKDGTEEEKVNILDSFEAYSSAKQLGSVSTGGGDIEGAIALAEVGNPDKIIVIGDLEGHEQSPSLNNQEEQGENRISVIALGQSDSTVDLLSGTVDAPLNPAYNELIVGEGDSYTAESMDELKDVIGEVIDNQITTNVKSDYEGFKKYAKFGTYTLLALGLYESLRLAGPRPIRGLKKFIGKNN